MRADRCSIAGVGRWIGGSKDHPASSRLLAKEALNVSQEGSPRLALSAFAFVAMTACGSSSVASTPSTTASVPTPTAASRTCPTGAQVGSALGVTLPSPTGVVAAGGTPLPTGAKEEVCEYKGSSYNVIIVLLTNIDPSYISKFSDHFPVPYASVPGVGDQARSFSVSLGGGRDNEGLVATKGRTLVAITATATPASLAQIEALVNSLL
jgi:hypothetical protein